jgi:hypothetical protein
VGEVAAARIPDAPPEGLPQNEPDGPPAVLMEKTRWHTEEAIRQLESAGIDRTLPGMRRLYGLVELGGRGLMYRLEALLKS